MPVRQVLHEAGIDPAPDRAATTWPEFLRSQAHALLAADFIETVTLTGTRLYILAVIERAIRRIWILGAIPQPDRHLGWPRPPNLSEPCRTIRRSGGSRVIGGVSGGWHMAKSYGWRPRFLMPAADPFRVNHLRRR